ncbi:MAG: hypothetical protein LAN64_03470 [Acidobacteriia bacterium]|nr:hypothetical protein [Terriglobia bacterium]
MDKFARYYSWFLLVATALPAAVRLTQAKNFAQLTCEKISDRKRRVRHRMWGWISLLSSFILVPVYFLYSRQRWMIVALLIGVLTGVEMIRNAHSPDADSLTRQNRYFGVAYAAAAAVTWLFLIHK